MDDKTFVTSSGETETGNSLREKYNPDGSILRKAQLKLTDMLLFLDKVCKENGIEYFLSDGNLLGAARHGGFIPWDDDMDITILRNDFKKLKKVLLSSSYKDVPYVLQCHESDNGFKSFYAVLRDKNSEYIQDSVIHKARKYRGLQIDIFPYSDDVIPLLGKFCYLFERINMKFFIGRNNFVSEILFFIEKCMVIPICRFISLFKFNKENIKNDYACFWNYSYKKSKIFPLKTILYEGHAFPCPNDVDYYLRTCFGDDYMILPDSQMRNNHKISEIRFL